MKYIVNLEYKNRCTNTCLLETDDRNEAIKAAEYELAHLSAEELADIEQFVVIDSEDPDEDAPNHLDGDTVWNYKTAMVKATIDKRWDDIIVEMSKADADAYRSSGAEFRVYIDTDGNIGTEEWIANSSSYFRFHDPDYDRYYLGTFCHQYDNLLWDWWFEDMDDFRNAFCKQFGINPYDDEELWSDPERYGREICEEAGIEGFDGWLEEQRDEAIESATDLANSYDCYENLICTALDKMEF